MSVLCQFPFRAGGRGGGAGARSSGEGGTYCTTRALGQAVLQLLVKLISSSLHSEDTLGNIQTGTLLYQERSHYYIMNKLFAIWRPVL